MHWAGIISMRDIEMCLFLEENSGLQSKHLRKFKECLLIYKLALFGVEFVLCIFADHLHAQTGPFAL